MPNAPSVTLATSAWFREAARDLPWRRPEAGAWGVLVSEVMLQQTPVARVLGPYAAWMHRWPNPQSLAADSAGEAVRMWGRLGYPRRALRLHACATKLTADFGGDVPSDIDALLSLPGVGAYTARAVAAFAFGQRTPVVDTNVRRVVARSVQGQGEAGPPSVARDLAAVEALLPEDPAEAAQVSAGLMELGALICTARSPVCGECPVAHVCAWRLAGYPAYDGPSARPQKFNGTDRQVRGLLMATVRDASGPVSRAQLDRVWHDAHQRDRALHSLLTDGLLEVTRSGTFRLPT
jgi:A/G-specific adenine glycosylase